MFISLSSFFSTGHLTLRVSCLFRSRQPLSCQRRSDSGSNTSLRLLGQLYGRWRLLQGADPKRTTWCLLNGALVASDEFIRGPGGDQQLQDRDVRLTGLANQLTKSQASRQSSKQSRTSQICYLTVWFCYAGCVLMVSLATTVQLVVETAAQVLF